ncbi:MAG: hypothetical protein LBQ43_00845 [Holosporales bacterium]|jgi:hypothetical protein|nr:hypothetical protein [Holosporales bacterium]
MNLLQKLAAATVFCSPTCMALELDGVTLLTTRPDASITCFGSHLFKSFEHIQLFISKNYPFMSCDSEYIILPEYADQVASSLCVKVILPDLEITAIKKVSPETLPSLGIGMCKDPQFQWSGRSASMFGREIQYGPDGFFTCSNELPKSVKVNPVKSVGIGNSFLQRKIRQGHLVYHCGNISLCTLEKDPFIPPVPGIPPVPSRPRISEIPDL